MQSLLNRPNTSRQPARVILNTLAKQHTATDTEKSAVRQAVLEGRDVPDRAMDKIVDRLMKELSW